MSNIEKITTVFEDNVTVISANHLNVFVSRINSLIDALVEISSVPSPSIIIVGNEVNIIAPNSDEIRYTINGNTPTANSGTVYNQPFTLTNSCYVKAIAIKNNIVSQVSVQQYVAAATPVPPTIVLNTSTKMVTLSAPSGLAIKYSADGSTPATPYSNAIDVSDGAIIKAITVVGQSSSSVPPITIKYDEALGTIEVESSVTGTIRFTTNEMSPTSASNAYSGKFIPVIDTTYKFAVFNGNTLATDIATVVIA